MCFLEIYVSKKIDNQKADTVRNMKRITSGKIKMIPCEKQYTERSDVYWKW